MESFKRFSVSSLKMLFEVIYQNESEVSSFAKHPGVGGEHQVGGERVESLAPHLRKGWGKVFFLN